MNKLLSLLGALMIVFASFTQENEMEIRRFAKTMPEQDVLSRCYSFFQEDSYYYLELLSTKLLEYQPDNALYNFYKGYAVLNARNESETAIPYLVKAIAKMDKYADFMSIKAGQSPYESLFYLAKAYHIDGQLDKAIEGYTRFIEYSEPKSEGAELTLLSLKQCEFAKKMIERPKKVKVINLGDSINTSFPEYSPFVSIDGSALYFTSRRSWNEHATIQFKDPSLNTFHEDIYVSYSDETGIWSKPHRLDFCEDDRNEASISVSSDERRFFLYQDDKGNGDIFFTDFNSREFEDIKPLKISNLNTNNWETHIATTIDGQNIYFVSNRPGGFGGRDIYRIVRLPNGEWSLPQNLGPTINTPYDEEAPFIDADNKTLYYASNGPSSMGGFDILVSVRDEDNNWQTPINLGFPINSTGDDLFYTSTIDGNRAYITSYRKGGKGEKDIYEIQNDYMGEKNMHVLKGKILTVANKAIPSDIFVQLKNLSYSDMPNKNVNPRYRDGSFFTTLDACSEYEITFIKGETQKEIYKTKFNTNCNPGYEEIYKEILLDVDRLIMVPNLKYAVRGTVVDSKTNDKLKGAKIELLTLHEGRVIDSLVAGNFGEFQSRTLADKYYGDSILIKVRISKPDYITQTFDLHNVLDSTTIVDIHTLSLQKNVVGLDLAKVLNLKPIYFDLGKATIRPDAKVELNKIVKILNDNPTIKIELGSHTDCRSSAQSNLSLSEKRAKASAEYIKKRIINPARVSSKGYGESQLVNKCECEGEKVEPCTEEEHQENRRTEFKIVEE